MKAAHPNEALFKGERPFPVIASCEHFAGSEKLIRKALALQDTLGPVFDVTCDCEDGAGGHVETVLGQWDCVSCPAEVIHGYENVGLEPAYLQVMLGKGRPDLMSYVDGTLQARRDEHLKSRA